MARDKDLVQIIRNNPTCVAIIDNDSWRLFREHPRNAPQDHAAYNRWREENLLADDNNVTPLGDGGYGSGNGYGGDILQALAAIVGMRVESV